MPFSMPSANVLKSLELQKKLQYCYSTIINLRWYCSSIVKKKKKIFILTYKYLPLSLSSLSRLLSLSLSLEHSLSSLLSLVFVLQLLSPLLKPKTPCGGGSGRGRRGSSNTMSSSLWRLGLSNGPETRSNQPNLTELKPNGWIQMAWSVGYGPTFFENRNFGSGGRL